MKNIIQILANFKILQRILSIDKMLLIALSGAFIVLVFFLFNFLYLKKIELWTKVEAWGQTGDFFGGILNPFFTLVGLFFVIKTIQQNEKALNHSENELIDTKEALKIQIETAEKQRFETTFFNLLSLSNEIKEKLDLKKVNSEGETTEFYLYFKIQENFIMLNLKNIPYTKDFIPQIYKYLNLTDIYHALEQYYQNIYNIMTFIDNADFLKDNLEYKKVYANVIRSQLSIYETGLLFFAFLCYENGKFCRLAKEWGMFDILFNDSLFNEQFKREDFSLEKLYISLLN